MKRTNDNLSNDDSVTQLDKNFSRLLKLTGESNKPGRKFAAELINGALNELKQSEVKRQIRRVSRFDPAGWRKRWAGLL